MITAWMNDFFLCLNPTKTKILIIRPQSLRDNLEWNIYIYITAFDSIRLNGTYIGNNCFRFVKHAKNLGIIIDEALSFEDQINRVVKSFFGVIRKLAEIKPFLLYEQLSDHMCMCIFED